MERKWLAALVLLCALPNVAKADEPRQVAGIFYEEEGGAWYQLDSNGERWEVRRGRLGVRFDASFSQDSVATIFAELGVFLREPDIALGGCYLFSYGDSREGLDARAVEQPWACDWLARGPDGGVGLFEL